MTNPRLIKFFFVKKKGLAKRGSKRSSETNLAKATNQFIRLHKFFDEPILI